MSGTELRFLANEFDIVCLEAILHCLAAMTVDHNDAVRGQRPSCRNDMLQHRLAGQRMHDLGYVGMHSRAFAGSENDDVEIGHL
jgi:hypothetical protein